jgi:hypothetical protein
MAFLRASKVSPSADNPTSAENRPSLTDRRRRRNGNGPCRTPMLDRRRTPAPLGYQRATISKRFQRSLLRSRWPRSGRCYPSPPTWPQGRCVVCGIGPGVVMWARGDVPASAAKPRSGTCCRVAAHAALFRPCRVRRRTWRRRPGVVAWARGRRCRLAAIRQVMAPSPPTRPQPAGRNGPGVATWARGNGDDDTDADVPWRAGRSRISGWP